MSRPPRLLCLEQKVAQSVRAWCHNHAMETNSTTDLWVSDPWTFDDGTPMPLDFDTGSVRGRVCGCCTFDESVIGFSAVPDAWGLHCDGNTITEIPILEFPRTIWHGKVYCDRCFAVATDEANGAWDRELSRALRAALKVKDAIVSGETVEPFPYPGLVTVRHAPASTTAPGRSQIGDSSSANARPDELWGLGDER